VWLIAVLLLLCGSNANAFPFSSDIVIGKIVPLEGLVVVRRKSEGITVKPPSMIIFRGDDILTDEKGKARILLTGGNEVYVGPSSTLYLDKNFQSRYNYEYNLNLKGKLRAKFQRVKGRSFRIKTSTALINVKGTDFIVDGGTESTQVATFSGLVELTSLKTQQKVDIPPGQMSSVTTVGKVLKLEKVKIEIVKDLENTGKTGIKTLDTIMEPPPPLDPSVEIEIEKGPPQELPKKIEVAKVEPPPQKKVEKRIEKKVEKRIEKTPKPVKPPSMWAYAEEYRKRNRLGLGFGTGMGVYIGNFLFLEYNLTARSQLHYQYVDSIYRGKDMNTSLNETELQRKLSALSYRWFLSDSGTYFGVGVGHSTFEQKFDGSRESGCLTANAYFHLAEIGMQTYGQALGNTFYVSLGSQFFFYDIFNDNYYEECVSATANANFTRQAKHGSDAILLGFGWFF